MSDLTSKLIKEFASVTNDVVEKHEGAVVYGEISIVNEDTFIKIDGSDILTPCTTTVKVKSGHRVIATVKDHKVTVTSNITDPSAYGIIVDEMGIRIKGFVTFESLQNGTTTIDGSCIKTGTIDAERINLTGKITFKDLAADAKPPRYQYSIDGETDWHDEMTDEDYFRRETLDGGLTYSEPYQFRAKNGENGKDGQDGSDGSDASVTFNNIRRALIQANSTQTTFITAESTGSPNIYGASIYGGEIYAGTGSMSMASMIESGFSIFYEDHRNPKVMLGMAVDEDGIVNKDLVRLVLGAGSTNDSETKGRFFVEKGPDYAGIYYYTGITGDKIGLTFNNDGTITGLDIQAGTGDGYAKFK